MTVEPSPDTEVRADVRAEWLTIAGDADAWRAIGLTVTDDGLIPLMGTSLRIVARRSSGRRDAPDAPDAGAAPLAREAERPAATDAERPAATDAERPAGITGWALSGGAAHGELTLIDGLPTEFVDAAPPMFAAHAIGASTLDHVVVATPDLERTSRAIAEVTGHELKRVRDLGKIRQGFHRLGRGGLIVEIVEHADAEDGPAAFWGVVLIVDDLDAACAVIGPELIPPPKEAVQPGRRIATVRAEAGLGVPLALMSPDVPR